MRGPAQTALGTLGSRHSRRSRAALLALVAFALLYVFPYQATLNNPNENVRLYMTAALVEEGRYEIDSLRERWGWVNDAAVHDGHVYSVKAPGTSMLGVPGYFLYFHGSRLLGHAFDRTEALWVCRVTASILPTLLFAWFFLGFLERRTQNQALARATFFSVLLGSLLYAYALLFVSHTLSAVVAFGAFMWLYEVRREERPVTARAAFMAGLGIAGATFFEYPGLACSLPLALYALLSLRKKPAALVSLALGGLLPALVMMHFHASAFGSPFTPGHLFVESDAFREAHHQGIYGAVGPSAAALYGLLVDPGAGLFPLTPLLLFALPGYVLALRDARERVDTIANLAVVLLTLLAISSMNNWRGGWTMGPRYLALCVPFLALPALRALDALAARAPRAAVALALACTAVGFVASGIPSAYYPHLPPELTRPLPQLFAVLIAHDFAPRSAGNLVAVFGTPSMLPLLAVALACLEACVRVVREAERVKVALAAIPVALVLSVPIFVRPKQEPGVREAVAFVTRRFSPKGHDQAARLREALVREKTPDRAQLERLAGLYTREGRDREARAALRGRL